MVIGCFFCSLIGAGMLQVAAKRAQSLTVNFGDAYVTVLLSFFAMLILGIVVDFSIDASVLPIISLAMMPVNFAILSGIISYFLKIPFGRGCIIALTMICIAIGILIAIGVVGFGIAMIFVLTGS